jgi:hypothetical protein
MNEPIRECVHCGDTIHQRPGHPCRCEDNDIREYDDQEPGNDCEACNGTGWVWCGQFDGSGEIGMECPEC